jgi:hypothetical protein
MYIKYVFSKTLLLELCIGILENFNQLCCCDIFTYIQNQEPIIFLSKVHMMVFNFFLMLTRFAQGVEIQCGRKYLKS